jgi:hypothetical protein
MSPRRLSGRSYWEPAPESIERHLAMLGWPKALHDAYKYDTRKLSAYLRRTDLPPLNHDQLEQLADLIGRRIHRRAGTGRKAGRIPPRNPDEITEGYVVALARDEVQRMKERNGGRTPRGAYRAAILGTCRLLGDDGYNVEINVEQALAAMRRGKRHRRT